MFNIQTATIGNLYHVNSKLVASTNSKNYWIIVNKDKILSTTPEEPLLLTDWSALPFAHEYEDQIVAIGEHNDKSVYLLDLGHESVDTRLHSVSLRNALTHCPTKNFNLLAKSLAICAISAHSSILWTMRDANAQSQLGDGNALP